MKDTFDSQRKAENAFGVPPSGGILPSSTEAFRLKSVHRTLHRVATGFLVFGWVAGVSFAESYDQTWRYATIAIPRIEQSPKLDGAIADDEWGRATLLPPFLSRDPVRGNGLPSRHPTRAWMAYTTDALCVAWRQALPPHELPVKANMTARDTCEGSDNTVVIWFGKDESSPQIYNISGNAASATYDRRFDDGSINYWNPKIEYVSKPTATGWDGELKIPFAELGWNGAPEDGKRVAFYLYSSWRKTGTELFAWPYVGWSSRGEHGILVFGGNAPAVRFEDDGAVKLVGGEAQVATKLYRRKEKSRESYLQHLDNAIKVSQVEGGTFESLDKIVAESLTPFEPASKIEAPGEYLVRYDIKAGDRVLASGVQPFWKAPPLDLDVTPFYLSAKKLLIEANTELPQATRLEASLNPVAQTTHADFKSQQAQASFSTSNLKDGPYEVAAAAKDAQEKILAKASVNVTKPAPPDWWTKQEGFEPKIPPPWTPVKASKSKVNVLLREYQFDALAVPSQVETLGKKILAGPMEFRTSKPWEKSKLKLVKKDNEAAVYESESVAGGLTLKVRTQVEFDGFMYVDIDLTGEGDADKLDFVIPFKKEHAILMQNYFKSGGPGDLQWKNPNDTENPYKKGRRFVGYVPDYTLFTPPMLTTWIGTDKYGLEWSSESSRGWSLASPNKALEISRDGDKVVFTAHLITRPVKLTNKPRRIRFGLVATPTKTILPHMAKMRIFDDWYPALLPADWSGHPCWHGPVKDPKVIEKNVKWIEGSRNAGAKIGLNGGWNISTDHSDWEVWGKEMVAEPLQNVSWQNVKNFAACYKTPYAEFMANSFGFNARLLKFDGIRFDTIIPSYECQSLVHDCGWYDDDGKLQPSSSIFSQREIWKRLYRIFHGGVRPEGAIWLPVAAGPIMCAHSFSDIHEIGESYYEKAKTIKDGYPPDMIRANMTGIQYGMIAQSNIKGVPLMFNQRNAALLVNGSTPRFTDYRFWRSDYSAQGNPAVSIWDAWDWVDRWNAEWLGWWENGELAIADCRLPNVEKPMLLTSFWLNRKSNRLLLIVTNYETEPMDDASVKLNLAKLGLKGKLYAEDAVTLEPVAIRVDGAMKIDILPERYRLIKVSNEPPRYRDDVLGANLVAGAPAEITQNWSSAELTLDPNSTYVLKAQVKIDQPLGVESQNPNADLHRMFHYVTVHLAGEGITGVNATNKLALCAVKGTDQFLPYRETDFYRRMCLPQVWENTPGWQDIFVPFGTATNTTSGKVVVAYTDGDAGKAAVKNVTLQKVK